MESSENKKPRFKNRGFFATPEEQAALPRPSYIFDNFFTSLVCLFTIASKIQIIQQISNNLKTESEINDFAFCRSRTPRSKYFLNQYYEELLEFAISFNYRNEK